MVLSFCITFMQVENQSIQNNGFWCTNHTYLNRLKFLLFDMNWSFVATGFRLHLEPCHNPILAAGFRLHLKLFHNPHPCECGISSRGHFPPQRPHILFPASTLALWCLHRNWFVQTVSSVTQCSFNIQSIYPLVKILLSISQTGQWNLSMRIPWIEKQKRKYNSGLYVHEMCIISPLN